MDTNKVLDTYYAVFQSGSAPGAASFLKCDPSSAITATGPLEPLPPGSHAVFLCSTRQMAEKLIKRHRLDPSWDVAALGAEHTKIMLTEGRSVGLHTHVAFNPPANIVGVQPIDEFIASMPLRTLKNSEPAP